MARSGEIANASLLPRLLRIVLIGLCLWTAPAQNQGNVATATGREVAEHEVKAVFLLNFVRFVEWPAQAGSRVEPFYICILGDEPFDFTLDRLVTQEAVNGRPIEIRRLRRWQEPCQMLFVSRSEQDVFRTLRRVGPGVLTVGEEPGFLRDGGMINFVLENRRVRFDVNRRAAEAAGLRISSQLLSVARTVSQ